jgi:tetratricopeptide (TPR) repeat protein
MDTMWIFIALLVAGAVAYFLLHTTPDDRVRKAEAAIGTGNYPAATKQIDWLLEHQHPRAAATLARLFLAKAQAAGQQGQHQQVLPLLDNLYGVRTKHPIGDQALVVAVEKESGEVLLNSITALAAPFETAHKWADALKQYETGLQRTGRITALAGATLDRLQTQAVACHENLLRVLIQPQLNAAATALPLGRYDEAEQALRRADTALRGPFEALAERAATRLRPLVQTQRMALRQAQLVAEATRLLVQAQKELDGPVPLTVNQLARLLTNVDQAQSSLATATGTGMPAHTPAAKLQALAQTLKGQILRRRGECHERNSNWVPAHNDYASACKVFTGTKDAPAAATVQLRQSIIALKSGTGSVVTDANVIQKAEPKVRLDMAYRAALGYLKAGDFETASVFIPHLTGHLPEAATLTQAVNQQRLQALRLEIEQANSQAQDEQATFADLRQLYDRLPSLAQRIAGINDALGQQLTALQPLVFGRLLTSGLAQSQLLPLLDLLTAQPGFYSQPEALKNVGIVCLQLATTNGLTAANHQQIVALWLTALHASEVLLASLETTSWDDKYTFTLADSLGVRSVAEMPENVNRMGATESNISLGEAQKELMRTFETTINSIADVALQTQVVRFYDQQKQALTNLIEQIDRMGIAAVRVQAAAPFAAAQFKTNPAIVNFLVARYQRELEETSLDCALPYQTSPAHPQLTSYQAALELERKAVACFATPRLAKLKTLPALLKAGLPHLKSYSQLNNRLAQRLTNDVRTANAEEDDGALASTFDALVTAFPVQEQFKVMGAHHLCEWCIGSLNAKRMESTAALDWLVKGWEWVPDDERLASNLCIVFGNAWHQADGSKQATTLQVLEKTINRISPHCNRTLQRAISTELLPIQNDVHAALRKNGLDINALIRAAAIGYSSQFTAEGIRMGKNLIVLQKMVALTSQFLTNDKSLRIAGYQPGCFGHGN